MGLFTNNQRSIDPEMTQINLFYGQDFSSNASNLLDLLANFQSQTDYNAAFDAAKVSNDPISTQANVYSTLNSQGFANMDAQFVAKHLENFRSSLELVQRQVYSTIGKTGYFQPVSDSIGLFARIGNNIYDDSTCSISDINSGVMPIPSYQGISIANKVSPTANIVNLSLSKICNSVHRSNINPIQEKVNISTNSHGQNLVPDAQHVKRMNDINSTLYQNLQQNLGGFFNVVDFYNRFNSSDVNSNFISVPPFVINVNIEGAIQQQDILQRKVDNILSNKSNSAVLSPQLAK